MPFNEIYGRYFDAIAAILAQAVGGELTQEALCALVQERAFGESMLTIPENLKNGVWPLLTADLQTPLRHVPAMPLTKLQKQWMKALLADPRIRLFGVCDEGLQDVSPLYAPGIFVRFDQYSDGDPYQDEGYIARFQTILTALREKRMLKISFSTPKGLRHERTCIPHKLEYSAKDDKFRLLVSSRKSERQTINLARIQECALLESFDPANYPFREMRKSSITLELTDERNALERVMLHFSHLERRTEKLDENRYRIILRYEAEDETELLIRVLSFGPVVQVVEPESFIHRIQRRLKKQAELLEKN